MISDYPLSRTVRSSSLRGICLVAMFWMLSFPAGLSAVTHETLHIPWSGYWWPFSYGGLSTGIDYRGQPAPLVKYEMLVNARNRGPSILWYENRYYRPDAVAWAGLCPSWARAAAYESYAILPSSIDNIVFRVGDKKGLLTLCHDDDLYLTGYGYLPEEFHLWLLQYIRDEKRAFTADLHPSDDEIWYYPIYRYDMTSTRGGMYESVNVTIYYATDNVHPDYIGTLEKSRSYTYTLTYNSQGDIIDGEWTGASINSPPKIMKIPLSARAANPYLDCDRIQEIARSRDDFLERAGNAPVYVEPGTYHLVLLDPDEYIIDAFPDDEIYIEIVKQDGSLEEMEVSVMDQSGRRIIGPEIVDAENDFLSFRLDHRTPPYRLLLTQANYLSDPNIYTLMVERKTAFQEEVYCLPVGDQWSGFALTNSGDEVAENAVLVAYDKTGAPWQTLFGPVDIGINEKKLFMFHELPRRRHESADLDSVRLLSDRKIDMVNLFAFPNSAMGGGGSANTAHGSRLVIPDTHYTTMGPGVYMKGSIVNPSFQRDAPVEIRLFAKDGSLADTITAVIAPGRKIAITPGFKPFLKIRDGGWMDIVSTTGVNLSGYQYIQQRSGGSVLDTLPALPVVFQVQYVPHIPPPPPWDNWQTELTLVNPHGRENRIVFHYGRAGNDSSEDRTIVLAPYEKRVVNLTDGFVKLPGDALFQSVLEIRGDIPFAGYYAYSLVPSIGDDKAGYPLLNAGSFKKELILPHVPGSRDQWWTGVGICNPGDAFVEVIAEPYGNDGHLIEDLVKTIPLDPGAYDVFDARLFFKTDVDIAFVRFRVDDGPGSVIGGFYLYGNKFDGKGRIDAISGANM